MRRLVLTSLLLWPALASADIGPRPVIGGEDAAVGAWPDVVAVMFDSQQGCSGTLIAPKWVLTASHCEDTALNEVLIGSSSLARPQEGEMINVVRQIAYPDGFDTFDVMLLELEHASTRAPRPIASGWARHDIVNGAVAELVGFGAIDRDANQYIDQLQQATSSITDAGCTAHQGCNSAALPNGELGAGGGGIDTCPGDSGGPLYLVTDYGTFLAGVTSRSYDNAQFYCSEGGVYVRPDAVVDWIEEQIGEKLPDARTATAETLTAESGSKGYATVDPNDPRAGTAHTFSISAPATHGIATVDADGVVTYQSVDGYVGPDEVEVEVADAGDPTRYVRIAMTVDVIESTGCCQATSGRGTAAPTLLVLAFLLVPRRRRAS